MVIASGAYFKAADLPRSGAQILDKIVVRFTTPDPDSSYHIPIIMAPNSYSCWWSAQ
jgi:5-hydroxyisourate hydrolase